MLQSYRSIAPQFLVTNCLALRAEERKSERLPVERALREFGPNQCHETQWIVILIVIRGHQS